MKKLLILFGMCILFASFSLGVWTNQTGLQTASLYHTFDTTNISGTSIYNVSSVTNPSLASALIVNGALGQYNQASFFTGVATSNINVTSGRWLMPNSTESITYAFWINITSVDLNHTIFDFVDSGASGSNPTLWVTRQSQYCPGNGTITKGRIVADFGVSGVADNWACSYTAISTGWNYVTLVYNGTKKNVTFFINGVQDKENSLSTFAGVHTGTFGTNRLGIRTDGSAPYLSGSLDEFAIYPRALTPTEITDLYTNGNPYYYPYANTTTLVYPINTTHYTNNNINTSDNFNGSIIINSSLNVTCTLNDTRFNKLSSTLNTTHRWYNNSLPDGNYSITTNCTAPNLVFWFVLDTTHPIITQTTPSILNTTILNYSSETPYLSLNISTYDTYLYQANLSLYNSTGHLFYSNYSGIITTLNYTYNWTNNLTNLTPSKYYLMVESSDSHTDKKIEPFNPKMDLTNKRIDYKSSKEWGSIDFSIELLSSTLELDSLSDTKKIDRHSPEFSFKTNKAKENQPQTYTFMIHSSKPLVYLQNSEYIGHFVSTDGMKGIWYDSVFDGYEGSNFKVNKWNDYTYTIEITTKKQDLKFNSLGGLNYNSVNSTFEVQKNLTIYLKDFLYDTYLTNFSININGSIQTTTGNSSTFSLNANTSYNITITKDGTINPTFNYITNYSTNENLTVLINTTSLNVFVYDEFTGALITNSITGILFLSPYYNSTTFIGGKINYTELTQGLYTYRASSSGYGLRTNTVLLTTGARTNLTVYLQNTTYFLSFVLRENANPNNIIENVTMQIYKYIGSTYTLIATEYSDVTGRIGLYYVYGDRYYFLVSKSGYQNKTFDFVPLFSEYTVYLTETISPNIDYSTYQRMYINFTPYTFRDGVVNNFSISFYNYAGTYTLIGFNATYPGGNVSNSSIILPSGGTLTGRFNISGSNVFSIVNLTIFYTVSGSTIKSQSYSLPIQLSPRVGTWVYVNPSVADYGLAIGDRVILGTILIIMFGGIATFYGGVITGSVVGLFMMCFLAYIGLVPAWFIYTSVFVGFVILLWRGSA